MSKLSEYDGDVQGTSSTHLVSVIVPTYLEYSGLMTTLESILKQDYRPVELIVSDDASPDFPWEFLEEWWARNHWHDEGIFFSMRRNLHNRGIVAHSNFVAGEISRGTFIKFLPPGDIFNACTSLQQLVCLCRDSGAAVVTSPALAYEEDIQSICFQFPSPKQAEFLSKCSPIQRFQRLAFSNIISAVGTLYHRSFFESGGFDPAYRNLDDWPNWLCLSRQGAEIPCLENPTVYYQLGGLSSLEDGVLTPKKIADDTRLCMEREILPYRRQLPLKTRWFASYRYRELCGKKRILDWLIKFFFTCIRDSKRSERKK